LLDEREREFQGAFLYGPPPLGPGAPPVDRLRAFLRGYVEYLLETHLELMLMAETARPGARYSGAHRAHRLHVAALVREARPEADAEYLSEALLAPLAAEVYAHQRRELGLEVERIQAGLDELLLGLE
jgi:hypothetical protein